MEDRIEARIQALIIEKDAYIMRANLEVNMQVASYDGSIKELTALLESEKKSEIPTEQQSNHPTSPNGE